MSQQQRPQRQHRGHSHQAKPSSSVSIDIPWVTNLTIGRTVYVRWKYSPLEHGKTRTSTVGINERAEFPVVAKNDGDGDDSSSSSGDDTEARDDARKKEKKEKKASKDRAAIEIKNKKKFRELSFVLKEVDEKGRGHDIGHAFLCLSGLVDRPLERQVLLELDADPKKSSTLLVNKRPILCLHVKASMT